MQAGSCCVTRMNVNMYTKLYTNHKYQLSIKVVFTWLIWSPWALSIIKYVAAVFLWSLWSVVGHVEWPFNRRLQPPYQTEILFSNLQYCQDRHKSNHEWLLSILNAMSIKDIRQTQTYICVRQEQRIKYVMTWRCNVEMTLQCRDDDALVTSSVKI